MRELRQAESDVDLMTIGNAGLRDVASRLSHAASQLEREITPHVMTPIIPILPLPVSVRPQNGHR